MNSDVPKVLLALVSTLAVRSSDADVSLDNWKPGPGWKQVWADEFVGPAIDPNNWAYDIGSNGWGNKELQAYTRSPVNSCIENGELVIKAVENKNKYTSARLKTQGKHSWTYGKIAARIRLPRGQGIWPAFWMLGDNITSVGWPKCGEIDIMEMIGGGEHRDDTIHGTLHWDANNSHASRGSGPKELPDPEFFYQNYHIFEVEWGATEVIWKRDGVEYFRVGVDTKSRPTMEAFHRPFFIVLNLAVGGNWPGSPDRTTVFPQSMYVDWIRVYKRSD